MPSNTRVLLKAINDDSTSLITYINDKEDPEDPIEIHEDEEIDWTDKGCGAYTFDTHNQTIRWV